MHESDTDQDYVVVGAGPAAGVLVRRLIDQGYSVHVLHTGDRGVPAPVRGASPGASANRPSAPAGDGGDSSTVYTRGHRSDYDHWSRLGAVGWDWESVLPFFLASEGPREGPHALHGGGGLLPVAHPPGPDPLSRAFIRAGTARSFPLREDFAEPDSFGVGRGHLTLRHGKPVSVWEAFVEPVLSSPLLTVTPRARVLRILFDGAEAVGVEYAAGGRIRTAYGEAEVVLGAGAVGSAKILMLSGLGPAAHLEDVGIPVRRDVPGVGANLQHHITSPVVYEADHPGTGGVSALPSAQLYWRSDSGRLGPDIEALFFRAAMGRGTSEADAPRRGYTIAAAMLQPLSRGSVRLASSRPEDSAVVRVNALSEHRDLTVLADAIEICREIGADTSFDQWPHTEVTPGRAADTREDVRAHARRAATVRPRGAGTCRMGEDRLAVVDPYLRVHGAQSLRIVDESVMPTITSGPLTASSVMIGERAAHFMTF